MKTRNQGVRGGTKAARIVLLGVVFAAMAVSASAQSVASATTEKAERSWFQKTFCRQDWSEVARAYETPREICGAVGRNIRYVTEDADAWAQPEETWARGRGDCEDFALLIQRLAKMSGMETKLHLYFPSTGGSEGHAVLVGEWNGKVWFSSNGEYEEVKSEDDVRRRVARMLSCKEKNLWVLKMSESDVASYVEKLAGRSVAMASR